MDGGRGWSVRVERIGGATLYCGDCLDILPELAEKADIIITDPPYSSGGLMRSDRSADSGTKYTNKAWRAFSGDNRDQRAFTLWCSVWHSQLLKNAAPGAMLFCFIDWRNLPCMADALQVGGWVWRGIIPWNKVINVRPQRGYFRAQCEYILWATAGPVVGDGYGWGFFSVPAPTSKQRIHPTEKPVDLLTPLLGVHKGRTILDPFMGSGTTGVAALKEGRRFSGIEQDEYWFDVACRRLETAAKEAEHVG